MHLLKLDFKQYVRFILSLKERQNVENIIYRVFEIAFKVVGILLLTGALVSVLADIQQRAFQSKRRGLINMQNINRQLVGDSK